MSRTTHKFPVIIGPTAGGKSALAVSTALELKGAHGIDAEIVTADSIQIFRGLDIGSAKPTMEERRGVPHHLIDIVEPTDRFSVDAWLDAAERVIRDLQSRGIVPIVVGGTHLYIKAFLEGLFEGPEPDERVREELRSMDPAARRAELERVDPKAAARIHPNDERRTVRALEVFRVSGRPISEHQQQWDAGAVRDDCFVAGVLWEVEALNRRINARVKSMVDTGLVEETRALAGAGRFGPQSAEALGYKQLLASFAGEYPLNEAIEKIKIETRRFGKNQRTWLRRLRTTPRATWFEFPGPDLDSCVQVIVRQVLGRS